ncbi:MAG: S1 RNA-binding domain-containing protein, partial [Balneolaceae bacterium]
MTEELKQETEKKEEELNQESAPQQEEASQETETTEETSQETEAPEETAEETVTNEKEEPETVEPEEGSVTEDDEDSTEEPTAEETVEEQTDEENAEELPTFTGELSDTVYTFDQLEAASEDYTDEEFNQLAGMYENTLNEIEEKEIVTGLVVDVNEKYVVVDIGFKSEGIVPVNEFSSKVLESLQPGDEVEVFLDRVEDHEGQLILSRRKADILQAWEAIENAHDTNEIIEGTIQRRIKGGMVVDIFGIDAFLPGSQIDVRPVRDFDAYVGKTMEFQVVKLNMQAENVVVSHRALIESDLEEQREEILETIESGQVLEGIVKNITDFGVFIDLGGVDGLLHITDLSWGRVEHPEEIV